MLPARDIQLADRECTDSDGWFTGSIEGDEDDGGGTPAAPIPVADFLAGLRTAWQMGEVRPTAQPTRKPERGRRRPDPLIAATDDLRSWFEADPAQTGSQLLLRLQASDPDRYPDARSERYSVVSGSGAARSPPSWCSACRASSQQPAASALGNICVRQPTQPSGTLLNEATRVTILIAALQTASTL